MSATEKLCFGPFELNMDSWELSRSGMRLRVQQQPLRVLALLLRHPGELITREELCSHLWPNGVHVDFDHGVNRSINKLRRALRDSPEKPRYIETLPARGYRFIGSLEHTAYRVEAIGDHAPTEDRPVQNQRASNGTIRPHSAVLKSGHTAHIPIPCRGALPLDSPFYIERKVEAKVRLAIQAEDSVVLLKGARQTGKTSLLARSFVWSRSHGGRTVITDVQKLGLETLGDINSFLHTLAGSLVDALELEINVDNSWESRRSPGNNFERFLRRVLATHGRRIVWGIDEADRLFQCPYAAEFFGLLRAWHNERALDPDSNWQQLTIVIAYATEAHLFIADANQSPFNVGTKFELGDFTREQIVDLNVRYGSPADRNEVSELQALVGGHPFLVQLALYELATRQCSPSDLAKAAGDEDGPFADHLRHLLLNLERRPELLQSVRGMLDGSGTMSIDHFYRLRAFGILAGDQARNAIPRCKLYRDYLCRHLM